MRQTSFPSVLIRDRIAWAAAIGRSLGELVCLFVARDLMVATVPHWRVKDKDKDKDKDDDDGRCYKVRLCQERNISTASIRGALASQMPSLLCAP